MSIIGLGPRNFDLLTLETHPSRSFASSSAGVTGSVFIYAERSRSEKDAALTELDFQSPWGTGQAFDLEEALKILVEDTKTGKTDINNGLNTYLSLVNGDAPSALKFQTASIKRKVPGYFINDEQCAKQLIKENMFQYYRVMYPTTDYAYSNYHTLNFFTGSQPTQLNQSTALLYPAPTSSYFRSTNADNTAVKQYFAYRPHSRFTFCFYVNPRENGLMAGHFKAGTVMHMSSCYAISLVSGSQKDLQGLPSTFRVMLQLSHSADVAPSKIDTTIPNDTRSSPQDLVFVSSASLKHNHWHHVAIRWGNIKDNHGTGSFFIDGELDSEFHIPSMSAMPTTFLNEVAQPDGLFIGNYYEGTNVVSNPIAGFFSDENAKQYGVADYTSQYPPWGGWWSLPAGDYGGFQKFSTGDGGWNPTTLGGDPTHTLIHQLSAEIHDLRIYGTFLSQKAIKEKIMPIGPRVVTRSLSTEVPNVDLDATTIKKGTQLWTGRGNSPTPDLMFYLPPFFTKESPYRNLLKTPAQSVSGSTTDPFNVHMHFNNNMRMMNLQNFGREFVLKNYPRFLGCEIPQQTADAAQPSDGYGHQSAAPASGAIGSLFGAIDARAFRRRNTLLLPCDNGKFQPNFGILHTGSLEDFLAASTNDLGKSVVQLTQDFKQNGMWHFSPPSGSLWDKYVTDQGELDFSLITLDNLYHINTGSVFGSEFADLDMWNDFEGSTPLYPLQEAKGEVPSVLQLLKNSSSNFITIFDVPYVYYGKRILPETLLMKGSVGTFYDRFLGKMFSMTIKLRDDGKGNVYRADSITPHAKWNNVGNIFYNRGIILVKSPAIGDFGESYHHIEFEGDRNIHVLEIMVPLPADYFNESHNITRVGNEKLRPSDHANDERSRFVYLTGMNLHDDNFNLLVKTTLAQPVIKRIGDKLMLRLKIDF